MKRFLGFTLILALLTSCSSMSSTAGSEEKKIEVKKNLLNGLPGSDNEIIVVKIDDTNQARPQTGIEDADVVYIEQVEGGLQELPRSTPLSIQR